MGAIQIASSSMVQSIEENSVRKGYDPRDFALVAEGGAGPLFAAAIAAEVGHPDGHRARRSPGVTAALGLLATDAVYEYVATTYQRRLPARRRRRCRRASRSSRSSRRRSCRRTASPRTAASSSAWRTAATSARATSCASTARRATIDDGAGWANGHGRLPRRPRARVLAALRRVRHRDPQHPRARRSGSCPSSRPPEVETGERVAGGRAAPRARRLVPGRRRAAARSPRSTTPARR